jgi:hypothetical protein
MGNGVPVENLLTSSSYVTNIIILCCQDKTNTLEKKKFFQKSFHTHTHPGVNFTIILCAAYTIADPKSTKDIDDLTEFAHF